MTRLRKELARRVPLYLVVALGYFVGWHLPGHWPEVTDVSAAQASSAGGCLPALATLLDIQAGRSPRASAAGAAAWLEGILDRLVAAPADTVPIRAREIPAGSRRAITALVGAYRKVFPTDRPGATSPAAPPASSPEVRAFAGPALRRALEDGRVAALWTSLQGRGAALGFDFPRSASHLVVRLDDQDVVGRLRVYGDGTVVRTGPEPEPVEAVRHLDPAVVRRVVAHLLAGGILAPDAFEWWRQRGADGCRHLARRSTWFLTVLSRRSQEQVPVVTVRLSTSWVEGSDAPRVPEVERSLPIPSELLHPDCAPDDPVVQRLRLGFAALRRLAAAPEWASAETEPRPRAGWSVLPGLVVRYNRGPQDALVTDGRRELAYAEVRHLLPPGSFAPTSRSSWGGGEIEYRPSPRGDRLAYHDSRLRAGHPGTSLFTVTAAPGTGLPAPGARPVLIARGLVPFDWAPSGDTLVYATRKAIREVSADGRDDRELIGREFGAFHFDHPRVSPDGAWLLFELRGRYDVGHIFVARRDGTEAREIAVGKDSEWVEGGLGGVEAEAGPPR